jgi:Fe2+ transport system protein FeoA
MELRSPGPEQIPLTHVPRGEAVAIGSLREMPAARSARLSAFGVVPGSTVSVLQRRPVPVIRIGETEIALSEEILGQIWVERPQRAAARWTTTAG